MSNTFSGLVDDADILQPYIYLNNLRGKNIRSKLISAINVWMNIGSEHLKAIDEVINMLHEASMLIDDIQDDSPLRRGEPVAHKIFGIGATISAANYIYFLAMEKVMSMVGEEKRALAASIFNQQMLVLHRGQGMDIYWRDSYLCPTEEEYKHMVIQKTGGLFNLAVRLMHLFSEEIPEGRFKKLIDLIGQLFQIRDDYANLCAVEYANNKGYADDITEGKFSLPVIHAIRQGCSSDDTRVMSILRQRTRDVSIKSYFINLLRKVGSLTYTCQMLDCLVKQVEEEISVLGHNEPILALLAQLNNWYSM